jgi:hypothetical protein
MKNIIKNHFLEIKKILNNSNDIVNKVEKISIFLKRKIKKKK